MARKKFTFALDGVLRLRKHEADQARLTLADASQLRQSKETALADAEEALREATAARLALPMGPTALRQHEAYCAQLKRERDQAAQALERSRADEAAARAVLFTKHQAEEALHTLRDDQADRHRKEQIQHDIRVQDEHVATRHGRRPSSFS